MLPFENKPIQDWTLAECKEYCENTYYKCPCAKQENAIKYCALAKNNICQFSPYNYNFTPPLPQFTPDEIAYCRLIKKTQVWAHYIVRSEFGNIYYMELKPKFDGVGFKSGTTGLMTKIDNDFFPQIAPMTYYAINDIIKQGENNNA